MRQTHVPVHYPDGSPHVTGIGALWADGHFWTAVATVAPGGATRWRF